MGRPSSRTDFEEIEMSWQAANIAQRLQPCREAAANPAVLRRGTGPGLAGLISDIGLGRAAGLGTDAELGASAELGTSRGLATSAGLGKASRGMEKLHPGVGWRHG
jgi:hypothetical protein